VSDDARDAVLPAVLDLVSRVYTGDGLVGSGSLPPSRLRAQVAAVPQLNALECAAERAAAMAVLDRVPFGLLVLDADCGVHFANETARRALDDGDPLVRSGDSVHPWMAADAPKFESLVERTCRLRHCQQEDTMTWLTRRCSAMPFGLLALHLEWGIDGLAAILMPDREREQMLRRLLVSLFGLTTCEAHMALLMLQGHTIERAARERGITRATARAYWQTARWKIGADADPVLMNTLLVTLLLPPIK
jgi:DNA-binding CsgD family transcriptional regulator